VLFTDDSWTELDDSLQRLDESLIDLVQDGDFEDEFFIYPGLPRIRPILVLLSAYAAHQNQTELPKSGLEHVALSTEFLHAAILMHDAALGRQGGRRRRVARRILGAVGWLGGNHFILRSLELARQAPSGDIISELLDTIRETTDAQALVQEWAGTIPTLYEVVQHAEQRSGAVFSFACRAGARLASADRPILTSLGRYGFHVGVAWQLAEELAVVEQLSEDSRNAIMDFAARGQPLYSLSWAAQSENRLQELWTRLQKEEDPDLATEILEILQRTSAISETRQQIALSSWSAQQALKILPRSAYKEALSEVARSISRAS
jgi:octaprenyl-diphosphate synthase